METSRCIKIKSEKEIRKWLEDNRWTPYVGKSTFINPYGPGGFSEDMFQFCGKILDIAEKIPSFFSHYDYFDSRYGYGWMKGWVE